MFSILRNALTWLLLTTHVVCAQGIESNVRVVGGQKSAPQSAPFMASLQSLSLIVQSPNATINALNMANSPNQTFRGPLVDCGIGNPPCEQAKEAICLFERGVITLDSKVQNCVRHGGLAAIVYNHNPGAFFGRLISPSSITALTVSREDGLALSAQIGLEVSYAFGGDVSDYTFCGGSYLGDRWVLTAAHCVEGVAKDSIIVNLGSDDVSNALPQANLLKVENLYIHKHYQQPNTYSNDVALLRLADTPTGHVSAIPLASTTALEQAIEAGQYARALGRGVQDVVLFNGLLAGSSVTPLYEVQLPLVSTAICQETLAVYEPSTRLDDSMLCAGDGQGGSGVCFGDSGGPLTLNVGGQEQLIGLTSWGIGCALPNLYDVFARTPQFTQQIDALKRGEVDTLGDLPSATGGGGGGAATSLGAMSLLLMGVWRRYRRAPIAWG